METQDQFIKRRARVHAVAALEASTDLLIAEVFSKKPNVPKAIPPGWHFSDGWVFKRQAE